MTHNTPAGRRPFFFNEQGLSALQELITDNTAFATTLALMWSASLELFPILMDNIAVPSAGAWIKGSLGLLLLARHVQQRQGEVA